MSFRQESSAAESLQANNFVTPETSAQVKPRPWLRFFARTIDNTYFAFLIGGGLGLIYPGIANLGDYVVGMIVIAIMIFVNAAMLSTHGTTPGKSLLKIRVTKTDGKALSFEEALKREAKVWVFGMGCGIPLVAFVAQLLSYQRLNDKRITKWDEASGLNVHQGEVSTSRAIAIVGGAAAGYVIIMTALTVLSKTV
jgi:hypothetical protein